MAKTHDLRLRLNKDEKEIVRNLARAQGFSTITAFVRQKIFDADLSTHQKLNRILKAVEGQAVSSGNVLRA